MFKILELRVENQIEPINIIEECPRFSWVLQGDSNSTQKSYHILVSTTAEHLGDLYNSQIVESKRNFNISYAGKALDSRQVCFIKLEVTSNNNEVARYFSKFEIALKKQSDWHGRFIAMPVNYAGGTIYFRKELQIPKDKVIERARVYLCGIGYSELYLNGKKVDENKYLNPGQTDYDQTLLYDCYKIDDYLVKEHNVIGVEVGYGWLGNRMMLLQMYIDFTDGTVFEDYSFNNQWWTTGTPVIYNSVFGGETYDAREEKRFNNKPLNWSKYETEASWEKKWMYLPILIKSFPKGKLVPQKIPPIRINKEYEVIKSYKHPHNITTYDIGQNISGWVKIVVKGQRGSKVIIKYAERLDKNNYANQLNLRTASSTDTYILKGGLKEVWHPRFTYHGFQYVDVILEGDVTLLEIKGQHVYTASEVIGSFETNNEIINKLHKMSVITEQNNEHSIFTDCPQRDERFGWINDLTARAFQTVNNFNIDLLFAKVINDIVETQNESGAIADTAPFQTAEIPADCTCASFLLLPLKSYVHYGNEEIVSKYYANYKAWVEYLLSRSTNYIMDYYYYGDWVTTHMLPNNESDNHYISTIMLYWHLLAMQEIAVCLNNESDIKKYDEHLRKAKQAINDKYYKEGIYSNGTQTALAMPLNLGLVAPENYQIVLNNLVEEIKKQHYHLTCGNQGYRHVFEVLAKNGYAELVIKVLTNKEYPGWGYMVEQGGTTVWERWEAEMTLIMHSFDHCMFGSYDQIFYEYLGGFHFKGLGMETIIIEPKLTSISKIKASIKTIHGLLSIDIAQKEKEIFYIIMVPISKEVTFISETDIFEVDEKKIKTRSVLLKSGKHIIKAEVKL
ncbi:MAG: family 78 glycoside hydrolase catalytic domain [Bacillales bacterium]|jgi:alpha-L-rhamnosidase|nr:family 78 glycoside hydrolase catalytic domain [Bacillales bacterium]